MTNLRHRLLFKIKSADNHLDIVKGYLEDVGTSYSERVPGLSDKFALLYGAVEELQKALSKLQEEM